MNIADFQAKLVDINASFEKAVAEGKVKGNDDILKPKNRFISKAGIYEVKGELKSVNGYLKIVFETDSGEGGNHFVNLKDYGSEALSCLKLYKYVTALGVTGLKSSKVYLETFVGLKTLMDVLTGSMDKPFRLKVKGYWKKDTHHIVYITRGQYQIHDENEKPLTDEGFELDFGSKEEALREATTRKLVVRDFMEFDIIENVVPIVTEGKAQPAKKPVVVEMSTIDIILDDIQAPEVVPEVASEPEPLTLDCPF